MSNHDVIIRELDDYQERAGGTAVFPRELGPLYPCLGDLGEAGEYASIILQLVCETAATAQAQGEDQKLLDNLEMVRLALSEAVFACARLEVIKKKLRKGEIKLPPLAKPSETELPRLRSELGDGLWYKATGATMIGATLSQIASDNIAKLLARKQAGVIASSGESLEERCGNV